LERFIIDELGIFETEYGKNRMKLRLLKDAFNKKNEKLIINLYLQLLGNVENDKYIMKKVKKFMDEIDYRKLQFEKLSNELSPLDFYNEYEKKLDDWQIDALNIIESKKSLLVCAPTSCGKTWLSIYPGIEGKNILFIVPTNALVYQVGSLFKKCKLNIMLITDRDIYGEDNASIVVGTPLDIEDKLPIINIDFDIIVIDEIHNLNVVRGENGIVNQTMGNAYERIIKIFSDKQILGLSATIGNPKKLKLWLEKVTKSDFEMILYSTRFLNLQRHLFENNKLSKLHPLNCINFNDLNSDFMIKNLPMTPYDCIVLYNTLNKNFPNISKEIEVKKIFKGNNRRLSLEDARYYELKLKKFLIKLSGIYPQKIEEILKNFYKEEQTNNDINLYSLFREVKRNNLTPCIVFQENTEYCKEIFVKLVGYLEKLEAINYPYYYNNLEFRQQKYLDMFNSLKKYKKTLNVPKEIMNKRGYIESLLSDKEIEINTEFVKIYFKRYEKQKKEILLNKKNSEKIKRNQIKNLENEYSKFSKNSKLKHIDIWEKHPEFCLNTSSPMKGDKIREIKRLIKKQLKIEVSYTNVFMQGLKRGIGIYTKDMPSTYNNIVQKLAQYGELGFVVADLRLALGINMPFRSSCILGYKDYTKFDIANYLQMIGRSGRRGKDREGHIIYANVEWKNLMKGELGEITSIYQHIQNYKVLNNLNVKYDNKINNVFENLLDKNINTEELQIQNTFYEDETKNILTWKLRLYSESVNYFIQNINSIEMNSKQKLNRQFIYELIRYFTVLFINKITDKEILNNKEYITEEYLYNKNVIIDNKFGKNYSKHNKMLEFLKIIKIIYNILISDEEQNYPFICKRLSHIYELYNNIIIINNILN
jgi:ATP-dependent RNA helicase DDX60